MLPAVTQGHSGCWLRGEDIVDDLFIKDEAECVGVNTSVEHFNLVQLRISVVT